MVWMFAYGGCRLFTHVRVLLPVVLFPEPFLGAVLYLVFLYLVFFDRSFLRWGSGPCRYMGKVYSPFFLGFPVKDIQDAAEFPAVCF